MDEFVVALVGILAALAVLMLIAGVFQVPSDVSVPRERVSEAANLTGAFVVGPSGESAKKPFDVGRFNTSYIRTSREVTLGSKELFNGVLFGSNRISYFLEAKNPESLEIAFRVARTNSYAPLSIRVNGQKVEERTFIPGEYKIPVDKSLNESMVIEIAPLSSSWRIWAPAFYGLEDIRLIVRSYSSKISEYEFLVLETEYRDFREGIINLALDENTGSLTTEINGQIVHSGSLKDYDTIRFNRSSLKLGRNTLAMKSDLNSVFSGRANMTIEYKSDIENFLEVPFNVTRSQRDGLEKRSGLVKFTVVQVSKPGGLEVKLLGDSQELFSDFAKAEERTYEFSFGRSNVLPGSNRVQIRSAAGAVFAVKDVAVVI